MKKYEIPLVPGPVSVPEAHRRAYMEDYGSSDLEEDFFSLLLENQRLLKLLLNTEASVIIESGEAMLALWGALKSTLSPCDRVLSLSNGVFGRGLGEMAATVGAAVEIIEADPGSFFEENRVREAIKSFKPTLVTAVHCETPSGLLNPIAEIAGAVKESGALFCVDFVASAGGTPVLADEWGIDLGLLGSQKCLSLLPDISVLTVSERAWRAAERVNYSGYDALLPWKNAADERLMPYTHNWHANAALNVSLNALFAEGLEKVFKRHEAAAALCRSRAAETGLSLHAVSEEIASPTVTAINVPEGWSWPELDAALRARGMAAGGSYGEFAGKIFRIGHMGSQADMRIVERGMNVLEEVIKGGRR